MLATALVAGGLGVTFGPSLAVAPAAADTAPVDPTLPETVSAAALPTVQINGVVWKQIIVGNRVYATGQFTQARPAGAAVGTNETPRSNILAYDLTTGNLITDWAPTLNAQGLTLAASADGSTIYVGGDFDQVSGQWRSRIAALDAQTGAVKPFNPGANTTVRAIAVNGQTNTVYFGGAFTSVGNTSTGTFARTRLAAADGTTGALLPWAPTSDRNIYSMVVHEPSGRVIVGGNMTQLNGTQQYGMGSFDGVTGTLMPWAANQKIMNYGDQTAIASLTTDGEKIYGTGWSYVASGSRGNFEGVFAADPLTGNIIWIDGGRGDNYDLAIGGGVAYSVGHPHDWGMLDWNPQYPTPWQFQRTAAIDIRPSPTLYNAYGTGDYWYVFAGMTAAQPLHWLPTLTGGTYTGQGQAAWSVATNGDYVVEGGEFPSVNGTAQQGLVRFAKRALSPQVDEIQNYTELTPTLTPVGPGSVRVGWQAAWDRDNAQLKVEVLRGDTTATSTVLKTFTTQTTWWNRPPLGFLDTTAPAGTTQTYRIRVTDPFGNGYAGPPASVTIPSGTPSASAYAGAVRADSPDWYWRLGETSGQTGYDTSGSNDLSITSSASRNVGGALLGDPDGATRFPSTLNTGSVRAATPYWQSGPQTFSLESWVKTNTSSGGVIIGFGDSRTGRSGADGNDRVLYLTNSGQIRFGVRPDMGDRITVNSPSTYRDNQWHHVVGTLSGAGLNLYVDGNLVASNPSVTKAQTYRGYWRVGGNRLQSWPSAPSREAISADLDEVAVYPTALSLGQVRAHYDASGRNGGFPNINPTARFTSGSTYLTASVDGTTSSDDDGTIASYAWTFGDGTTGAGATNQHTYASAGTYDVSLTVTDDRGGTNTVTHPVTVTDPPPNVLPTASFTSSLAFRTASLTSTSTDSDGTIVSSSWDFGDGTTGAGTTAQHTYSGPGTYPVTLTVTDDRGGTDTETQNVTVTELYASDTFERTVANGLGSADVGGPWTLSGAASSFAVSGGAGRVTAPAGGTRAAYLQSISQSDVDIKADLTLDRTATGGGVYVSLVGRRVSNNNDYRLKLRYQPNGTLIAYLVSNANNSGTTIASGTVPGLTVNPGEAVRARFQVAGTSPTTLKGKVWKVGTQEPQAWTLTATESTTPASLQAPGNLGALVYTSGSWTGTAPTVSIDDLSAQADAGAPVNIPPTASFTTNVSFQTVSFDGTGSTDAEGGTITSYLWDFGDGTTGVGPTNQHTYSAAGDHTVSLTVTDDGGATNTTTQTVTTADPPPNVPPTASFTATPEQNTATFTSTSTDSDGTIASAGWDFGDGATGTGASVQHAYAAAGTYPVTLTVTDDDGATDSDTQSVTVTDPPSLYALDAFGRDVSNGLGVADLGGTWTTTGAASSFSVSGGAAHITAPAGATRAGYLASIAKTDVDLKADVTLDSTPTGGGAYVSAIGRRVANNTDYRAQIRYQPNGTLAATLTRNLGGTVTTLATAPISGLTVSPGQAITVRLRVTGSNPTTLQAKVWLAGAAEPTGWTITGTDASTPTELQAAGGIGVLLYTSGSWSGAAPSIAVDNVTAGSDLSTPIEPPANVAPTASFTSSTQANAATLTSTSADPDGVISSTAWDFGDGATGTGTTVQHTYAAAGTYPVTLTVTDNGGATDSITQSVIVTDPPAMFDLDAFGRDVTGSFGTADLGGDWTHTGAASAFSVSGGAAHVTAPAGATRAGYLMATTQTDVDLATDVTLDSTPTGGGAYVSVISRRVANNTDYRIKLRYQPDGTLIAYLTRNLGGTVTTLATAPISGLTVNPGEALRVRLQVFGSNPTTLRAKVWHAEAAEPAAWTITGTDASTPTELQTAGGVGVLFYTSGSWTGAAPSIAIDNLAAGPVPPE